MQILEILLKNLETDTKGKKLVEDAYQFASEVHSGQTRKTGEPYIMHPVGVSLVLSNMKLEPIVIAAALLHDTVEDTPIKLDTIRDKFGEEVANLVDGVTKLSKLDCISERSRNEENFRKLLVAMARDVRVILIKIADRLHNMRTLDIMHDVKKERIAKETQDIYVPICGRLGLNRIKTELEDLCFKFLKPKLYENMRKMIASKAASYKELKERVTKELNPNLDKQGIKAKIFGRVKHIASVYRKMEERGLLFKDVHDVLAFRIIVDDVLDCYTLLGIIHELWTPIPGQIKDYIALPKENGYQSLHTVVVGPIGNRIEIQIRTWKMHRIAEYGIAAHWKYKDKIGKHDIDYLNWLRALMDLEDIAESSDFFDAVKLDLFAIEVYVFTPKNEIIVLPKGSTPIDFAYNIHTEIGLHYDKAIVNGNVVAKDYKLMSGDVVYISTDEKKYPILEDLKYAYTSRARIVIRHAIKEQKYEKLIKLGKDILQQFIKQYNLDEDRVINSLVMMFKKENYSKDDIYYRFGLGIWTMQDIIKILPQRVREKIRLEDVNKALEFKALHTIDGFDEVLYKRANCCKPLPYDLVVGVVTKGITVHRNVCRYVADIEPERKVDIEWLKKEYQSKCDVTLKINMADRVGILADISRKLNKLNVPLLAVKVGSKDEQASGFFDVSVKDTLELASVVKAIMDIEGVTEVLRV